MKTKKVLFFVTVVALAIAFAVSAFLVGKYIYDGKKEESRYEQLAQQAANATTAAPEVPETTIPQGTTAPDATESTEATQATEPQMLEDIKQYYDANDHTVGYIKIPNTKLDYPVVQTPEDPNYYLKRNFDRKSSERGTLYAWSEADINEPSDNITIFGHNMRDGSMFNSLMAYQQQSHWEKNSLILFNTLYERHTYKIFAVFKTSAVEGGFAYHKFVDAEDEEAFNEFIKTCKDKAFYDTGITPVYGDKIICLSTCEYTLENGRFVVCAVRWT